VTLIVRPRNAILLTDLLDAAQYPATALFDLYLARWGIERVFQQITEVFHLRTLIGTTPQGTVFQLAFCLLLYNLVQVVRAYVATAQARPVPSISTELLFDDVQRQLVAFTELVPERQMGPRSADRRGPADATHAAAGHDLDEPVAQATHHEAHSSGSADTDSRESHLGLPSRRSVSQTKSESFAKMIFTAVGLKPQRRMQRA
jgi:hypothetical protein